ncbi:lysine--tRNA ligase [candidate division NPL-UPA2 bacterium]|nr:lysine--tRNA ligase [candidate division NPL-UPA2 bacterium]
MAEVSELIKERRSKLEWIREAGIKPYAGKFLRSHCLGEAIEVGDGVKVAGRIMALRRHGKTTFADLRDRSGQIQIYVSFDLLGEERYNLFGKMDIGDFVGVEGEVFKTKTEELTIKVEDLTILSKSLRPLPEKWHGLKDVEIRYRQRYLDLIASEEVRKTFNLRSSLIKMMRQWLDERGFLEVETPMLQPIPGGAAGKPFKTHQDALGMDLYLRIAPELYLKRLLVGGFEKVYEINRSFRNEGISTRHNPEFTMLEVYQAYADYQDMMKLVEELIIHLAQKLLGGRKFAYQGKQIDLTRPWRRLTFRQALKEMYAVDIFSEEEDTKSLAEKLRRSGVKLKGEKVTRTALIRLLEKSLSSTSPAFVIDYPAFLCPLARKKDDKTAERFELFIGGCELANAYSELNDPIEQRERFEEQKLRDEENQLTDGDESQNPPDQTGSEEKKIDEDFIRALEYGMPPAGGLGLGIDRLVMLLTDSPSIRDVILFPQLRPEKL